MSMKNCPIFIVNILYENGITLNDFFVAVSIIAVINFIDIAKFHLTIWI